MPKRIESVEKLLRKELSSILLREGDFPEGLLVTLTNVQAFPNLQEATVYIRVIPEGRTKEALSFLRKKVYEIQQILNRRLRMRPVPKIRWSEDQELLAREEIEKLFEKIKE
ncbi:MAG: 30S ribosome-binding factor RbfA [bacterium]|nr:30S ribosome-binding factor RbfA [bacterium]